MSFISILFKNEQDYIRAGKSSPPEFLTDLNLDQIIDSLTSGWEDYDLKKFYFFPLDDKETIRYRQDVFKDLERNEVYEHICSFGERMNEVRNYLKLSSALFYDYHKKAWFLKAIENYCDSVLQLAKDFSTDDFKSNAFLTFRDYISKYIQDENFAKLINGAKELKTDLAKIKYSVLIKDNSVTVQNYESSSNYSDEILETFEKFKQGTVKEYKIEYEFSASEMNHVEAKILDCVAELNPDIFSRLNTFCLTNADFIAATISEFDREIHFYIAYLEYIKDLRNLGLQFCYPEIISTSKEVYNYEGFDLALAKKLSNEQGIIVCNDFWLKNPERIIVVSGPNQGGKTTFARMFGQLHYLMGIGCPVPGKESALLHYDKIFTQFERVEKVENLRGKLEDDLKRVKRILSEATGQSIIIMNEVFNSTTLEDMTFLSKRILQKISGVDLLCVWVTFVDELASFNQKTVSMTSTVVPENPAERTFKIVRRPADGLAYAMAIAKKYHLTYKKIVDRIK
jgi:DNA mismatch repair protein MutS